MFKRKVTDKKLEEVIEFTEKASNLFKSLGFEGELKYLVTSDKKGIKKIDIKKKIYKKKKVKPPCELACASNGIIYISNNYFEKGLSLDGLLVIAEETSHAMDGIDDKETTELLATLSMYIFIRYLEEDLTSKLPREIIYEKIFTKYTFLDNLSTIAEQGVKLAFLEYFFDLSSKRKRKYEKIENYIENLKKYIGTKLSILNRYRYRQFLHPLIEVWEEKSFDEICEEFKIVYQEAKRGGVEGILSYVKKYEKNHHKVYRKSMTKAIESYEKVPITLLKLKQT